MLDELSVGRDRAELTLALMEIEPYRIHGASGLPVECDAAETACLPWSEHCYHVTVEVQPLHTNSTWALGGR